MKRRYLIPEVIQTSAMDCGPAALKALFGGFGLYLSYGRLREACQTDVDGTSIDTIELIARQLGMGIVQSMLPADFLLLKESQCLPAIVVVDQPDKGTHVVVLWRVHGAWLQIMDPAVGRIWVPRRRFLSSLYLHEQLAPADSWEEWSNSVAFTDSLLARMRLLGIPESLWIDRAHQDAALRLGGELAAQGRLKKGAEACHFMAMCAGAPDAIPAMYWAVRRDPSDPTQVLVRGAVLLTASGPTAEAGVDPLPASLARVRSEPAPRTWEPVWAVLRDSGWFLPATIAVALIAAAAGSVLEVLIFRGLFDMGRHLHSTGARVGAVAAVVFFLAGLLALDWPAELGLWRLGRQLELRLRTQFFLKIPRLHDRNFQSRLISDMAFRAHGLQLLRQLPDTAGYCLRLAANIIITGVAIAWIYPGSGLLVAAAIAGACGVPALFLPSMGERDLRFREISAALGSFYLDSLLGSRAIQAHCAERAMRTAQAAQLRQWAAAGLRLQALFVRADVIQMTLTFGVIGALVYRQLSTAHSPAGVLLLIYWAISIPLLGQEVAAVARSVPAMRNTLLRFLELTGSPEEDACVDASDERVSPEVRGVKIDMEGLSVTVAGHKVLHDVTLHIEPGEHVGIVGASGAGKSSLVGVLLGWYNTSGGAIRVDGMPLAGAVLARLRRETAWIDPQVHLFRTTLFENLRYGNAGDSVHGGFDVIEAADLESLFEHSPQGLQMPLGEGGAMISGGEGQRVRIARALGRTDVRLAVLDEPTRGLGKENRRRMLATTRRHFANATLVCVTHDVDETLDFDRVLVIERGRIVEQGPPRTLLSATHSRYRDLLEEEAAVGRELWGHSKWRRLRLHGGTLTEVANRPESTLAKELSTRTHGRVNIA